MRRLVYRCDERSRSLGRVVQRLTAIGVILGALAVPAALATPAGAAPPGITGLVSPSHPLATKWYANASPSFAWHGAIAALPVAGYAYLLDRYPATVPAAVVDLFCLSFSPVQNFTAGTFPDAIAAGDLNRDGKPDLAVINGTTGMSVLLGKGDGRFGAPHTFAIADYGPNEKAIAIADLNGDGKPDIVTASDYGKISVLLGKGDGTFLPRRDYAAGSGRGLAIADLNGDHRPDIVVTDGDGVSVLLGKGGGRFLPAHSYVADPSGTAISLALRDVNGDGKKDVIVGSEIGVNQPTGSFSVLLGKGNGAFKKAVTHATGDYIPYSLGVADLNRDGKPDLVIGNMRAVDLGSSDYSGAIDVWRGSGNGGFVAGAQYATGYQDVPGSIRLADFNADGRVDVAATLGGGVTVFLGNGDGTLQPRVDLPLGYTPSPYREELVARDLNGDGRPDLAVTFSNGPAVSVRLNLSTAVTFHGRSDGLWYFHVRAVDVTATGGPTATRAVRIDTHKPTTAAPKPATVKRGGMASLAYSVTDPPPCAGWCNVIIRVRNGHGALVLRLRYHHARSALLHHATFRCRLAKGTYHYYVFAADAAGNRQAQVARNRLIVR